MQLFKQQIEMAGINPYIRIPEHVIDQLFKQSGKETSPIPVSGLIEGQSFTHTVIKFQGVWRLYLNMKIREATGVKTGDNVTVGLEYKQTF